MVASAAWFTAFLSSRTPTEVLRNIPSGSPEVFFVFFYMCFFELPFRIYSVRKMKSGLAVL